MGPAQAGDHVHEQQGVKVFIDADSLPFVQGSIVDYQESLSDSGFKITNPNAARSCGCGTSFEPAEGGEVSGDPLQPGAEENCADLSRSDEKDAKIR